MTEDVSEVGAGMARLDHRKEIGSMAVLRAEDKWHEM